MFIPNKNRISGTTLREAVQYIRLKLSKKKKKELDFSNLPCVFVLSTGRVGTQTLAALCGLAKNYFVYHEPKPALFGLSKLAYEKFDMGNLDVFLESFVTCRKELFKNTSLIFKSYMETGNHVTFLAPAIFKALPQARFIHLVRDPRDVVRSGMRRKWYDGHPFDSTRIVPCEGSQADSAWSSYTTFQKNLWLWDESNRWILDFLSKIPEKHQLLIHSEDIFNGHKETLENLFKFMDSPMPSARQVSKVLGKKMNVQRIGRFPNPSDWTDDMQQEMLNMVGETAKRLGYTLA
jgi:hypothetical protein